MVFLGLRPTFSTLKSTIVGHIHLNPLQPTHSFQISCSNKFYPLWILNCKDKACQKYKNNKKMILAKYLDFHNARNQERWSMPKLKIGQYCAIGIRICAKFQVFLKLSTWHLSLRNLPKFNIFGLRTHFGPHLLNDSWSDPSETIFNSDIPSW